MNKFYLDTDVLEESERTRLEGALEGSAAGDTDFVLELVLVDEEEIRRLNREVRGVDRVTDVLSFPSLDGIKGEFLSADSSAKSARGNRRKSTGIRMRASSIISPYTACCTASDTTTRRKKKSARCAKKKKRSCKGWDFRDEERNGSRHRQGKCGKEHAYKCARRGKGRHRLPQAADHARPHPRHPQPRGEADRLDTPGIYRQRNALTGIMMRTTENTSRDVDAILYVHDGHAGVEESDIALMKKYASLGIPMLIAYTKTDIMQKERIPEDVKKIVEGGVERDIFPVSARKGSNLKKLEDAVAALLPEGEPLFPEDVVSDRSEKFMIAEIMREKILLKFDQEIPHGVAIVINTFEKQDNGVYDINLDIVCEKPNHKAILIGRQGRALKEVASFARQDMEKFLGAKVFLTTYVKVRENWRDREGMLRELGYEKERED